MTRLDATIQQFIFHLYPFAVGGCEHSAVEAKKNTHISPTGKMVSLEICIQLGSVRFGSVQT